MRFAPEGYPFIIASLFAAGISSAFLLWIWRTGGNGGIFSVAVLAAGLLCLTAAFMLYFFRDPDRNVPEEAGLFVSPADGKVIVIRDVFEKDYLKAEVKEIGIFMSPMNVHVNRAPCDGKVSAVKHSPGIYMAAYKDDASIKNENIVMALDCKEGKVLVRQVAGFVARRAVCRVKAGDTLKRGERYGMIKFGSRLDVYLPKEVAVAVKLGDRVKAGESVLGSMGTKNQA
ncbi:MAG TPA: phosphatidylserine decarboxylase family protein [Thermodesulfovibrionales bacterium]|nr:phosphatidylserine decarboxylase family protein [Thermodesulfovibrionales bacterium]